MSGWTKKEVLENRHTYMVKWEDPAEGLTVDGQQTNCFLVHTMTVHDCINYERHIVSVVRPGLVIDEWELFQDFMVVHWAELIK